MKHLLSLVTLAALSAPALAQSPKPVPAPASRGDAAYAEGRQAYDLRDWDRAIALFKEAYALRADAASLFNIAQSYRLKGDCLEAYDGYKAFWRNFPNEKNVEKAQKLIVELEPCAKQRRDAANPIAPPTGATSAPTGGAITAPVPTHDTGRGLRRTGLIVSAVGLAVTAGGAVFAFQAASKQRDIEDAEVWDPELHESGQRADLLAKSLLITGGAALVTGGVLYFLGHRRAESPRVSVAPQRDGGVVVWTSGF